MKISPKIVVIFRIMWKKGNDMQPSVHVPCNKSFELFGTMAIKHLQTHADSHACANKTWCHPDYTTLSTCHKAANTHKPTPKSKRAHNLGR